MAGAEQKEIYFIFFKGAAVKPLFILEFHWSSFARKKFSGKIRRRTTSPSGFLYNSIFNPLFTASCLVSAGQTSLLPPHNDIPFVQMKGIPVWRRPESDSDPSPDGSDASSLIQSDHDDTLPARSSRSASCVCKPPVSALSSKVCSDLTEPAASVM